MIAIHISDIRNFRACRRKWGWTSPLKQNLEPIVPYIPFFVGKAFHAALEYYYRDGVPFDDTVDKYLTSEAADMEEIGNLWHDEKIAFEEQIDLIRDIIYHYSLWQAQDDHKYCDKNLEFVSLEQSFSVPMPMPDGGFHLDIKLEGRFDGIVKHIPTDTYWIWETKTTRSIVELSRSLVNDEQCGVYAYAASQVFDKPIAGILYNIVRKKSPSEPKELQSGGFSKAKNIDTTAFHYLSTIRTAFPDWSNETIMEQYGDIMGVLLENTSKFFMRYPVYRTPAEIRLLMDNIYYTAMDMVDPTLRLYPAPSWLNCNFCLFRSPCLAMNAGTNYEVLLEEEYRDRTHSVSMIPDAEEGVEE